MPQVRPNLLVQAWFAQGKALSRHCNLHQALKRNKLNQGNGSTLRQLPGQRVLPKKGQVSVADLLQKRKPRANLA